MIRAEHREAARARSVATADVVGREQEELRRQVLHPALLRDHRLDLRLQLGVAQTLGWATARRVAVRGERRRVRGRTAERRRVGDRPGRVVVLRLDRVHVRACAARGGDILEVLIDQRLVVGAERIAARLPVDRVRLVDPHDRATVVREVLAARVRRAIGVPCVGTYPPVWRAGIVGPPEARAVWAASAAAIPASKSRAPRPRATPTRRRPSARLSPTKLRIKDLLSTQKVLRIHGDRRAASPRPQTSSAARAKALKQTSLRKGKARERPGAARRGPRGTPCCRLA